MTKNEYMKQNKDKIISILKKITGYDMSNCFNKQGYLKSKSKDVKTNAMLLGFRSVGNPYVINEHFISYGMMNAEAQPILQKFMSFNKNDFQEQFNKLMKGE